ncbi:Wall-associated receptor kinase-like 14 [Linum grandiflorum]
MPNGTLSQHLHRERGEGLTWPIRLAIVVETAHAVAHLHSAIDPPIFHRDIKSSNILLDFNYKSKLADFGLSRLGMTEISHISTAPQGTPGYLDPQYHQNYHLSDKSDVYSFGVVLVEIITGRKAVDFSRMPSEVNLASMAADRIGKGRLDEIVDTNLDLNSDDWTISSIHRVAEIAFRCLAFERELRPSMTEVAAELEVIKMGQWGETGNLVIGGSSSSVSQCRSSSSTNDSERALSLNIERVELIQNQISGLKSAERLAKNYSPVSVRDPWLSEQSSPGSNSFQNNSGGIR